MAGGVEEESMSNKFFVNAKWEDKALLLVGSEDVFDVVAAFCCFLSKIDSASITS